MNEKTNPKPKMLRGFDDALWLKIRAIVAGKGKGIGPWLEQAAKLKLFLEEQGIKVEYKKKGKVYIDKKGRLTFEDEDGQKTVYG